MNKFWKKIIILGCIYIIIVAGLLFLVLLPEINKFNNQKKLIATNKENLDIVTKKLEVLQKYDKNQAEFKDITGKVADLWPDNPDVSKFIVQTEELAKADQFVIESVTIQEKEADTSGSDSSAYSKTSKKSQIQFTFNTSVPYSTLIDIIKKMEVLPRFNSIKSINIAQQDANMTLSLTGSIYYGQQK